MIRIKANDPAGWRIKPPGPDSLRGKVVALALTCDGKSNDEFMMRCRVIPEFRSTGESAATWLRWLQKQNIVRLA